VDHEEGDFAAGCVVDCDLSMGCFDRFFTHHQCSVFTFSFSS
jgi:hypothetical protein